MTKPRISVVIPIKNERACVRACIEGIQSQTLADELEIIFVDSGSTDGTLDILSEYPVTVHRIAPAQFNHGETRNLGLRLARGEFVAFTVADARAVDVGWLEKLVRHFDDPHVAGVCGQQVVPHEPDKNPMEWFRPQTKPIARRVQFAEAGGFDRLTPAEQFALCGWDDVTAMYRREVLKQLPFQPVTFAEDLLWAKDALRRGHAIVYDYSARVYHYHNETFGFRFRRRYTILFHVQRYFGHVPVPISVLPAVARCAYRMALHRYCPARRWKWLVYNVRLTLAEWLSGWLFWLQVHVGRDGSIENTHSWLCASPPQPMRVSSSSRP